MHPAALKSLLAKLGWTIAAGAIGGVTAPGLVDVLNLPAAYKPLALVVISGVVVSIKNFIASKTGDPTTTKFDGPLRSKKFPLKHLPVDQLDQVALHAYGNVSGVQVVENAPGDAIGDHGVNLPGET